MEGEGNEELEGGGEFGWGVESCEGEEEMEGEGEGGEEGCGSGGGESGWEVEGVEKGDGGAEGGRF